MRRLFSSSLALLLFLTSYASAAPLFVLSGTGILADSDAIIIGTLDSILVDQQDCSNFSFTGSLESATGRIEVANLSPVVAGATSPNSVTYNEEPVTAGKSTLSVEPAADCRIIIQGLNGSAKFSAIQRSIFPSRSSPSVHQPRANVNTPATRLDPTLDLEIPLGIAIASISGDITVQAYGANLTLAGETTQTIRTGSESRPYQSTVPGTLLSTQSQREAFVTIRGAHIDLSLPANTKLQASHATLSMQAGQVSIFEAKLISDPETGPKTATIVAPLETSAMRTTNLVQIEVLEARQADIDGQQIRVQPTDFSPVAKEIALGVSILFILLGIGAIRNRKTVEALLANEKYEDVLNRARRTTWMPVGAWRTRIAEAVAQIKLGLVRDASNNLEKRLWRKTPLWHYLMASLESLRHSPQKAEEHLAESITITPDYQREAESNPLLRDLVPAALQRVKIRRQELMDGF